MSQPPLLAVSNLGFERDDVPLFTPINVELCAGEILQIEGANGSGKTTFLRLLTGLLSPLHGEIRFRGQPVAKCRDQFLGDVHYLAHQPAVKSLLTPEENLRFGIQAGKKADQQITSALYQVGLAGYEDVPCYTLSAGQKRRVALARLLLSEVSLWILDEPYTAIDKAGVKFLESCMEQHVAAGGAVILSSHQDIALSSLRRFTLQPPQEVMA